MFQGSSGAGVACFGPSALRSVLLLQVLLFPNSQHKNAITWLLCVILTLSKVYNILTHTRQPCFSAHLGGGAACFGASACVCVILLQQWSHWLPRELDTFFLIINSNNIFAFIL